MDRRKMLAFIGLGSASLAGLVVVNAQHAAPAPASEPNRLNRTEGGPDATAPGAETQAPAASTGGTLVVYFSRAGENYPNLDLEVGNTAQVAGFIHERVGGIAFEILPAVPYPTSYDATTAVARREQDDRIFPVITGALPDLTGVDTVFIGSPNWWGEQPMVMQTFLRDRDLNNTIIVPFVTHEGSGFGNSLNVLSGYAPRARVLDGFAKRGSDVHDDPQGTRTEVFAWLEQLGY